MENREVVDTYKIGIDKAMKLRKNQRRRSFH